MKWIRVASAIADDQKIWTLAELAGCDAFKAIGHLVTLWGVMTEQAKTGHLADVSDASLERWAKWTGRKGRFAAAVRATLCDDAGCVTAWEKYQGAAIREHEADRQRKRAKNSAGIPPETPPEKSRSSGDLPPLRDEHETTPNNGGGDAGEPTEPDESPVTGTIIGDIPALALLLVRAANRGDTKGRGGEHPTPYCLDAHAHWLAEEVLRHGVDPLEARRSVYEQVVAKLAADGDRPRTLRYFLPGIERHWARVQAARDAALAEPEPEGRALPALLGGPAIRPARGNPRDTAGRDVFRAAIESARTLTDADVADLEAGYPPGYRPPLTLPRRTA